MLSPKFSFKQALGIIAMASILGGLSACSSSDGDDARDTAAATDAVETTAEGSVVPTAPSVSIVEVDPEDTTPSGVVPSTTSASTSSAEAPATVPQLKEDCKPLANGYDNVKSTWSIVQLTVESKGQVGKSFDASQIASFKRDLAALRKALAGTSTATTALATIERGYAATIEGDHFKDPKGKAAFDDFVKSSPDFAGTQKALGDALRQQGCVVVG